MEVRNELRYLLSVGLWERMAADGLLTREELVRAKRLYVWYVEVSVLYIFIRYDYELMVPVRYLDADLMRTLAAV